MAGPGVGTEVVLVAPPWRERRLPLAAAGPAPTAAARLRADLLTAVSVCVILTCQGMAYGNLAGDRPATGPFTALGAMLAYASCAPPAS